jgi:hypothetical protein
MSGGIGSPVATELAEGPDPGNAVTPGSWARRTFELPRDMVDDFV